jgi:beta-phosphoglucomutase-like phosphatase (HAD superfamily)
MKNLNLQAVMIDLDGTMVDTIGDFEVALNRALIDLNIPVANRALIERGIGKGSEHLIRTVLFTNWHCQKLLAISTKLTNYSRPFGSDTSIITSASTVSFQRSFRVWWKASNFLKAWVCHWLA